MVTIKGILKEYKGQYADCEIYSFIGRGQIIVVPHNIGSPLDESDFEDMLFDEDDISAELMDEEEYEYAIMSEGGEHADFGMWYENKDAKVLVIAIRRTALCDDLWARLYYCESPIGDIVCLESMYGEVACRNTEYYSYDNTFPRFLSNWEKMSEEEKTDACQEWMQGEFEYYWHGKNRFDAIEEMFNSFMEKDEDADGEEGPGDIHYSSIKEILEDPMVHVIAKLKA